MEKSIHYENLTLEQLVDLAKGGDARAVSELVTQLTPLVEVKATALANSTLERADLIQEGLIGLLRAYPNYDSQQGTSFRTFASTCVSNAMISALRKAGGKSKIPSSKLVPLEDLSLQADSTDIEQEYISRESVSRFSSTAKQALSPFEHQVFELYCQGVARQDIATHLGVSTKSIANALCRIKSKVKGSLI